MNGFDHHAGQHLEIDGARIYCEVQGRDADPALVLLHGGLGTMEDFNVIIPLLKRRFRLIGIDSRGQGKSTLGSSDLSYARMQMDVERVIEQLKLSRVSIIGFSDGGIVALRMAASSRSQIEKLVVIGTPCELKPDDPVRDIYAKLTAQSWRQKFPQTYDRYQALNPAPDFEALVKAVLKAWQDTSEQGYPQRTVRKIACDLLVARGDDDHLVSRASAFELVEQVPRSRLLNIPFAGHAAQQDQADLLMSIVNQFLQDA